MSYHLYRLRNVVRRYGERIALSLPELGIAAGRAIGIAGPNGSGKSTLLRMLAFLESPDEGEMRFDGASVAGREEALRRDVTLLQQDPYSRFLLSGQRFIGEFLQGMSEGLSSEGQGRQDGGRDHAPDAQMNHRSGYVQYGNQKKWDCDDMNQKIGP